MRQDADLYLSQDSFEALKERELVRRQNLEDLSQVLQTPDGQRVFVWLLRKARIGQPVSAETVAIHNFGKEILQELFLACPTAAQNIVKELHVYYPESR